MSTDIPSTAATPRAGCLMPSFVLLIAVGVMAVAFIGSTCIRGSRGTTFEVEIGALVPDQPTYVSGFHLYVVRLPGGEVIALSDRESRREDHINGCLIRYRELEESPAGRGVFRSDCTGATYDRAGATIAGSAPPMKRHPVVLDGAKVKVDTTTCTQAGSKVGCSPL